MKKITLAVFSFVTLSLNAQIDITSNLVLCLPMNGNASDFSGNSNNGIVTGATPTTNRFGIVNSAYHFNGINNLIKIPNSPSLESIEANDELTITAWCNINNWYQSWNIFGLIAKHNTVTDFGWDFSFSNPSLASGNDFGFIANCPTIYTSNVGVAFGSWDFYAFTYSKSSQFVKIYKNAILLQTFSNYGAELENTYSGSVYIGYSPAGPDEYSDGDIDDVKLYNRELSTGEIQALYISQNECSFSTDIADTKSQNNFFKIYPNPTHNILNFDLNKFQNLNSDIEVEIYDIDVKLIKKVTINNTSLKASNSINIENLSAGFYTFKIYGDDFSQNIKFVKN